MSLKKHLKDELNNTEDVEESKFYEIFDRDIEYDDGEEARSILRRGCHIYYAETNTPKNCVIKEYPDGSKELVSFISGTEELVKVLTVNRSR